MARSGHSAQIKYFPQYGWSGLFLILLFWYLNWSLSGLRTQWGFFPLWLGFCLTVDALVFWRKGDSLIKRSFKKFIGLFFISIPVWWLFELINQLTHNWTYLGREYFTNVEYALYASLCFSTVIPAMFETAELAGTFKWIQKAKGGPRIAPSKTTLIVFLITGLATLAAEILWPHIFYPFIWVTVYLLIEPVNVWMNNPHLFQYTAERDWRPVLTLWTGGMICGFFWELWNYYSFPKWQYDLPGLNVLHVFEMPLPGFAGFMAFALELYALYHFIKGLVGNYSNYLRLLPQ